MTSSLNEMKKCCNLKTCVVEGNGYFAGNVVKKKCRAAQTETEPFIRLLKHTHIIIAWECTYQTPRIHSHTVRELLLAKAMLKMTSEMWNILPLGCGTPCLQHETRRLLTLEPCSGILSCDRLKCV